MLQQGLPVADVAYYYGDHVPNFAQLEKLRPRQTCCRGYDYDVVTAEVLLSVCRSGTAAWCCPTA